MIQINIVPARSSKLAASARETRKEAKVFKLAVVGPIVTSGLGVARQCFECYRWDPSYGGLRCYGFGAGCIEYRPRSRDVENPACRGSGLSPGRE